MPLHAKTLFAENYVVTSSVTSMSIAQASGSTIFGDSADDTHLFIGNTISGSAASTASFGKYENIVSFAGADGTEPLISGSATSTGSFGHLNIDGPGLTISDEKTAVVSGNSSILCVGSGSMPIYYGNTIGVKHATNATFKLQTDISGSTVADGYEFGLGSQASIVNRYPIDHVVYGTSNTETMRHHYDSGGNQVGILSGGDGMENHGGAGIFLGGLNSVTRVKVCSSTTGIGADNGLEFIMSTGDGIIFNRESANLRLGTGNSADQLTIKNGTDAYLLTLDGSTISGSSTSTGSFGHLKLGNADTDATFTFGRANVGHIGYSDMAGFSHVDRASVSDFALAQSAAGKTIVNAVSGQPIAFKIGNTDRVQINSSGDLGIGIETALHKLHVVGNAFFTGNVSGSSTSTGSFGHLLVDGSTMAASPITMDGNNNLFGGATSFVNAGGDGGNATIEYNVALGYDTLQELEVGTQNVAMGYQAMELSLSGSRNVAIGYKALRDGGTTSTCEYNVGLGSGAGGKIRKGKNNFAAGPDAMGNAGTDSNQIQNNIAIGEAALYSLQTGQYAGSGGEGNIALGSTALRYIVTGSYNIAIGQDSSQQMGKDNGEDVKYNTSVGYGTLKYLEKGLSNTAIGREAMSFSGADGSQVTANTAVGYRSLYHLEIGQNNSVVGANAAQQWATGSQNTILGYQSAFSAGSDGVGDLGENNFISGYNTARDMDGGSENVIIGYMAGTNTTTANSNVLIGQNAGHDITTGGSNIIIGKNASKANSNVQTNTESIFIGHNTGTAANGTTNELVIGNATIGKGSNTVTIGDDNVTDIYLSEDKGAIVYGGTFSGSAFIDDGTQLNVPDYVFEPEYDLKSLDYVETHISQSKHLPGIPSRDDKRGWVSYDMGGRDMLLLEKIEELTLYVIRLEKRIKELENN